MDVLFDEGEVFGGGGLDGALTAHPYLMQLFQPIHRLSMQRILLLLLLLVRLLQRPDFELEFLPLH